MLIRRTLLKMPGAALLPSGIVEAADDAAPSVASVGAGADREGKERAVGVSLTTYKVLTSETGGALFVLEQMNRRKGGPSRHLHHGEDELFYVLEGSYVVEIGQDRFSLRTGDCVLGPRGIPHAWAFAGDTVGRLLISFAPAGKMEAFFNEREQRGIEHGRYAAGADGAAVLRAFGMELIGPPLALDSL